ncbi:MAG: hypothetical protein HYY58_01715 [Candidatus Omnitrophica bacterium]|nr:hypothetical protein [Candidatus Omnitrophota bacterium]MBI3011195.1 hypothetical protein [Candidatus Omnitrophota bacterium]
MAVRQRRMLVFGLVFVAVVSLWRMVSVEREKRRLAKEHEGVQQLVKQLEAEKGRLDAELTEARRMIEQQFGELTGLQEGVRGTQARLDTTVVKLAQLQREYDALLQDDASVKRQLSAVIAEKQQLEAKFSSLKELRLAIRDVKGKLWNARWAAWRLQIQAQREADQGQLALGNRGYLVRDGMPTSGASPKMHVHVLEPQPQ